MIDGHIIECWDVWEIEMNEGSYTDLETNDGCGSSCCDYTYQSQVDYYWSI